MKRRKKSMYHLLRSLMLILLAATLQASCSRYVLESDGFRHVRVGASFEDVGRSGATSVSDTLFEAEGYAWQGKLLEMKAGAVLIEEGFFQDSTIRRIRVWSPRFKTPFGIRVGDPASALKSLNTTWVITPIPDYGFLDLFSEAYPGYHFLFPLPEEMTAVMPGIDQVADSLPIESIVVM